MSPLGIMASAHVPAAGGAWAPTDLTNLWAWWDASAITGLSDSDPVTSWADSSGNGHTATEATATPTYVAAMTGSNIAEMPVTSWSSDQLTIADSAQSQDEWTLIALVSPPSSAANMTVIGHASGGTVQKFNGGKLDMVVPGYWSQSSTFATLGEFAISVWRFSVAGTSWSFRVNGAAAGSGTHSSLDPATSPYLWLGRSVWGENFSGHMAELIVATESLSDADCESAEAYLTAKWSLT